MENNISLIGMPAAGKSSVGVILAKHMNMNFLDTDILIQQKKGKMLFELINEFGLEGFCRIEEEVVSSINLNGCVIATGGSVVLSTKAMKHLKSTGKIVYLETSMDVVSKRLSDLNQRGVVYKKGQTIKDIYEERVSLYEKWADFKIDSSLGRPEDVMNSIISTICIDK
ncbi:MAG: shikimate kinase [Desulforegulaceae bacterium]|nr:shikimate kinase [Desulforegulaceae bacterium]